MTAREYEAITDATTDLIARMIEWQMDGLMADE
jgi:hypothetical protein